MTSKNQSFKKVHVRGDVISAVTKKGLKGVIVEIFDLRNNDKIELKTQKDGLFLIELDNSTSYDVLVKYEGYFVEQLSIPQKLSSVCFPIVLKPKLKDR